MGFKIVKSSLMLGVLMSALTACEDVAQPSEVANIRNSETLVTSPVDAIIGRRIADFELLDEQGNKHSLHDINQGSALVLMTQGNGCPLVRNAMPGLRAVRDVYASQGVSFYLLNPNMQDDKDSITAESDAFAFDMRVLIDARQQVGEALLVNRTAEIFVISPDEHRVVYHGPIDDRLNYQTQRASAKYTYLADALDAVISGDEVKVKHVSAPGCLINFPNRA